MSPPFYLTRAKDWLGGPLNSITEDEWWNYALTDTNLVCETKTILMADRAGVEFSVEVRQPVHLKGQSGEDPAFCIYWEHGNVVSSRVPSNEILAMLLSLAGKFKANVQDSEFIHVKSQTSPDGL